MMRACLQVGLLILTIALTPVLLGAQEKEGGAKEDPAHEELRILRSELVEAVNKADLNAILAHCDPDIVLTAQHSEVARGRDGLNKYLEKMVKGPNPVVKSYSVEPTVDTLSILHGSDTAIAYGSSKDHFLLTDGTQFTLDSRWTATLVKKDGQWLVAALHSSANVMDNAILAVALGWIWKAAAIAGALGLLLGSGLVLLLKRTRSRQVKENAA